MGRCSPRTEGQLGKPLQMGQGEIRIPLSRQPQGAIPKAPELGVEAKFRAEAIQGKGGAHQLLVGRWHPGTGAVHIGE